MPIEHELGTLIRRMNPYTNGTRGSMLFGSPIVAPPVAAAQANLLAAVARAWAASARARRAAAAAAAAPPRAARARAAADAAIAAANAAANAADPLIDLAHIDLVIDDFIANYSSADWVFRGQPQTVKRALQITYRYQVMDAQQPPQPIPGVYATEHILVGYAGGNSSG
jgi:hypothetical protein